MMKICKNCTSINEPEAESCIKCSMKGMMVDLPKENKKEPALKIMYDACINCGTSDTGSGTKCQKCNFPLPKVKLSNSENSSSNSNSKVS